MNIQTALIQGDGELIGVTNCTTKAEIVSSVLNLFRNAYGEVSAHNRELAESIDIERLSSSDDFALIELHGSDLVADIIIGTPEQLKKASEAYR